MSKNQLNIGEKIRSYRTKKNLSQEKLARLAEVSIATITKLEAGETPNPGIETVIRIAKALEASLDDLIK